ncbi:Aste57867_874 [Aphanomyces stellatus]|uniref:Aste57867_874 protein n=1 Tax=Aphanomyces stellatus TaxID=120398 RepID=A0A485K408_9STRA|nr:hypothetical protein As57867_000873 [Aphanomyces stellatus]VFT78098.1 Aste57867_874 [Aphanomyces stellatus]
MKELRVLWFGEMPQPVEWHPHWKDHFSEGALLAQLASVESRRNEIRHAIDHELSPTNQEHDDQVDLHPLETNLLAYIQLVEAIHDVHIGVKCSQTNEVESNTTLILSHPLSLWKWKPTSCFGSASTHETSTNWIHVERGMVVLCLACLTALRAEQTPSKDLWRRAAAMFQLAAQRLPAETGLQPAVHVWCHLCIVHTHAIEMNNVEVGEESQTQLARYHSALSRSAYTECTTAQSFVAQMQATSSMGGQLRWLVLAYKAMAKATYCWNEVQLYEHKPEIALLFCDAIIKTKLPMPPQYPHRICVLFTKVMQSIVASHYEIVGLAMDKKALAKHVVAQQPSAMTSDDRLQKFLAMEPLQLKSLQPADISDVGHGPARAALHDVFDIVLQPPNLPISSEPVASTHETPQPLDRCHRTTTSTCPLVLHLPHNATILSPTSNYTTRHRRAIVNPESASRDVRVAIRAHNLGLLPDCASVESLQQEWQYGVEPFTPRLDARQLSRGFTVPHLVSAAEVHAAAAAMDESDDDDDDDGNAAPHPLSVTELDRIIGVATTNHPDWASTRFQSTHVLLEQATPASRAPSPKVHHNIVILKRKPCGLCERAFPLANLVGVVVMKRILALRAHWGLHTEGTPKCSPASFLYRDVRVCVLCNDILYGAGENHISSTGSSGSAVIANPSTPTNTLAVHDPTPQLPKNSRLTTSIGQHVQQLRRSSKLEHTHADRPELDEIGYMMHQTILNDALLLSAPAQVHKYLDVTRRRGVKASQSSVLLLGVPSNAINPLGHRGIHTHEEQAPWWEVDLGVHCDITSVEIWNCVDSDPQVAARLFPCHILLLLKPGHRRSLLELKAVAVDSTVVAAPTQPLRWRTKPGSVCRHVRIVVDKLTYLHVERVHVFGTPRKDDLAKTTTRPATAAITSKLKMRFQGVAGGQQLPTATAVGRRARLLHATTPSDSNGSPRPKSAGFLMPTASSHRRQQLGHDLRDQIENELIA